jgi:WD40-like Beta Propeller Repeat
VTTGRCLASMLLGAVATLVWAAPAAAELGPIRLVSKTAVQQADVAVAPAISADGRYLAFQGRLGGAEGVFREDLQSGAIVRVATTDAYGPEAFQYATAPSISADGRYVSFTTAARLDPEDDPQPQSSDVYVADMATAPPTYELASALDGCDPEASAPHPACGLSYENGAGSEASGRVALSADGREVVFVTSAESDLTSGPEGSTPGTPTPPLQVVLRNLETDKTTLVSAERDGASMTEKPVAGGALVSAFALPLLRGAALSADGTTVAWIGAHLPAQVPLPPQEAKTIEEVDDGAFPYDEPLWRRVADGPSAPIRRVVAGDGAADPFPSLVHKNEINAAQGWLGLSRVEGVPRLSADGRTVALIGNPTEAANVFVVDMAPGLSRAQAVRQLTREAPLSPSEGPSKINTAANVPLDGHIFDLAISGDGERIALATARQRFPLAPPNLIGSPPASLGLVELYVIDRDSESLERVTHGVTGLGEPSLDRIALSQLAGQAAASGDGVTAPSFGGDLIAFGSTAFNLAAGDSNEASDAFLVEDREEPLAAGSSTLSPGLPPIRRRPRWRLTLDASSLPDGAVRIVAGVPAAGRLRAAVGPEPGGELRARRLAGARTLARRGGAVAFEVELPHRYRRLAGTREGLYAVAQVSFHHGGRKTLRGKVQVRFHVRSQGRRGGTR